MSGTDLKFKRIGKTDIYGYQSSKYVNFNTWTDLESRRIRSREARAQRRVRER